MKTQDSEKKSFRYSLDWRFFLPVSANSKILYIGEAGDEVRQFFRRLNINEVSSIEKNSLAEVESLSTFDLISIPYDFLNSSGYPKLRDLIRPDGFLLIGFSNRFRSKDVNATFLFQIRSILKKAGFSPLKYYGILPDQYIPEYIFPLTSQAIGFVLRHRYQYRLPRWVLQLISSTLSALLLSNFLPAYYVLAKADSR